MSSAAAKMPWYSSGSGDTDATSSSSASLLHSIYGSQASQLLFSDHRSTGEGVRSEAATTNFRQRAPRLRPKSSPASTMATRQRRQQLRPAVAVVLAFQEPALPDADSDDSLDYVAGMSLQQTLWRGIQSDSSTSTPSLEAGGVAAMGSRSRRPISASVVRLRSPPSAPPPRLRRPPSAPLRRPPSASGGMVLRPQGPPTVQPRRPPSAPITRTPSAPMTRPGRPPSAPPEKLRRPPTAPTQRRYTRPKTALGISRSSSAVLIDLEEEGEQPSTPLIRDTPPVNVTRQPEYFDFWLGKPLLERDFGLTVHKRKLWQRPKSDYGNRLGRRRKGGGKDGDGGDGAGGTDGLETVLEEGGEGDGSRKGRDGEIGDGDGLDGSGDGKGHGEGEDGDGGGKRGSGECETEGKGDKPKSKKKSHHGKKSKKGPKKKALLRAVSGGSEVNEEEYFKKSTPDSAPWLESGSTSSPKNSRFELPVDLRTLTDMTPLQYLRKHCVISKRWKTYSSPIFSEYDTNKDHKISVEKLKAGLIKAHHSTITLDQVISVLDMVQVPSDFMVDVKMFAAFCCLTERLFDLYSIHRPVAEKDIIEKVDFEGLNWKLRDCHVNTPLLTLLTYL